MNLSSYFFGTESKQTETTSKIYLLYGAKVTCSNEESYVVGVFNKQELAIKELNAINEKNQLTNVGRLIIDPETGIKEYNYQYFIVECDLEHCGF